MGGILKPLTGLIAPVAPATPFQPTQAIAGELQTITGPQTTTPGGRKDTQAVRRRFGSNSAPTPTLIGKSTTEKLGG